MKRILKYLGIGLGVLIGVLVVAFIIVFVLSNNSINKTYDVDVEAIDIPTDEETLAEGQRLYISRGCGDCHGEDGGGEIMIEDPALGTFSGSNLTSGENGIGADYTVEDYIRTIRYGVKSNGQSLLIMPAIEYTDMRDEELAAIIAYLQSLEPVDSDLPETSYGPIGRILLVIGELPIQAEEIDPDEVEPADVEVAASVEYGDYLAHQTCIGCHQTDFAGGAQPGFDAIPANITPHEDGIKDWTLADFDRAMREGIRPDGSNIDEAMPWQAFSRMTETEIEALWLYLQTVDPVADE